MQVSVYLGHMGNVNSVITLEQLAQDFTSLFTRRVFRLEALDYYDAPNEREPLARFRAGEPVDPAWREPWKKLVTEVRKSGRIMERVHIVSEPVSEYTRFSLLHGYPASVEAGEDVRIISRAAAAASGLPTADYWLFDDDLLAMLVYETDGRIRIVRLYRDEDFLERAQRGRDKAMRFAVPLAQYVAEHKISNERTKAA
jgi:hypothetical protein